MVKRIRISPTDFKVSKPGVDVDSATANQLNFNAMTNVAYAGVILKGTSKTSDWAPAFATSSALIPSGNTWFVNPYQTYRRMIQISFPAQSVRPDVLFMVRKISDTSWATPHYSSLNDYGTLPLLTPDSSAFKDANNHPYYIPDSWAGTSVWASTSTTTLTLRVDYVTYSAGETAWEFSYMVFQPPKKLSGNNWVDLPTLFDT